MYVCSFEDEQCRHATVAVVLGTGVRVDVCAGCTHCPDAGVQSWHMVSSALHGCVQQSG
jgi:hypothetical protein